LYGRVAGLCGPSAEIDIRMWLARRLKNDRMEPYWVSLGKFCTCRLASSFGNHHSKGATHVKALRTHVAGVEVHKDMLAITVMMGKEMRIQRLSTLSAGP
jgi:hypothetical protein